VLAEDDVKFGIGEVFQMGSSKVGAWLTNERFPF
jgi:hypothetical protein